jgi:hypothetical protein
MATFTRRQFLRSAGGLTFLALAPVGRGLFAAVGAVKARTMPVFTALPYLQPGPEGRLIEGGEVVRLAWQTDQRPAQFKVAFGRGEAYDRAAIVARTERTFVGKSEVDSRYNYVGTLEGLALGTEYRYRVTCQGERIAEGYFTTRQPRGAAVRFVAFGDNSYGEPGERAVAFHAYRAHPDFIMNTGDNVYESGLDNEYARYFFPVYNADVASPEVGAPLLRSIPFYTVMANHDVEAKDPVTKHPCADFDLNADALGYYTNFHFPLNGPAAPPQPTTIRGAAGPVGDFQDCAGRRFPRMANYSYDCGDAHFLCLDSNIYVDPSSAELVRWIEADLAATDARWKFVVCHHPPFNVGREHFAEQHMRALAPQFERLGVDFVLSGHEHNYQRTVPLRFAPRDLARVGALNEKNRLVPGDFTLDTAFDGAASARPQGIIYLVTGAGGKHLYEPEFTNHPEKWTWAEDRHAAYVATVVSDRHSFTVFDLDGPRLTLRQIDEGGNEVDRIAVSKA